VSLHATIGRKPITERVLAAEAANGIRGIQTIVTLSALVVDRAEGSLLWDPEGRRYIDLFMGVGSSVIGHSHPAMIEAVGHQLRRYSAGPLYTEVRAAYLERLAATLPDSHRNIQLYSTGSEAVEAALRLARSRTGRFEVRAFWGGFHGKTLGSLSLHGGDRKRDWGPLLPGVLHAPYATCHDCPLKQSFPQCDVACAELLDAVLDGGSCGSLAAVILEPVQGTNGNVAPPAAFLERVIDFAHRQGALVIFDEVITSFGRTGSFYAFEQLNGALPDIVVIGKAMASGLPASAIIAADHVVDSGPFLAPSTGSSTFGGNPVSMAAALSTLDVIQKEDLVSRVRTLAPHLCERLQRWPQVLPAVRDVQCRGFMIGIGLNVQSAGGWLQKADCEALFAGLLEDGVLAMAYGDRIRLYPSLNIPEPTLNEALDILEGRLKTLERR